jgi:hypothetical protein
MNNLLKYINIIKLPKVVAKWKGALVKNEINFESFKRKGKLCFAIKNL